jgi:hypothetical protein
MVIVTPAHGQTTQRTSSGDSVGPADQVICRRFLRIGTLADYYRTCKTRAEWDQERRNIRQGISVSDSCRFRGMGVASLCAE